MDRKLEIGSMALACGGDERMGWGVAGYYRRDSDLIGTT